MGLRLVWNAIGFLFLGIGIVGFIVPHMPGTVFLVIALGCFHRGSNEKVRHWMLNHKWFGKILTDWERDKSIPKPIKVISTSCIVFFTGLSVVAPILIWVKIGLALLGVYGVYFILSKPTSAPQDSALGESEPMKAAS